MLTRRRFLSAAALAGAGAALAGGLTLAGTYRFGVSRHRLALPGLERPARLVQLSDLHFGPWIHARSVEAWVGAAMREKPDLIVVTGDLLDTGSHRQSWRSGLKEALSADQRDFLGALAELKAPLGVYAVWGNHDYGSLGRVGEFGQRLESLGIQMLNNRGLSPRPDLYLAGVDDLWFGQPDVGAAVEDCPPGAACVLLCHNPDYLFEVPPGVHLTLCGHTHGGQVRLPLVGSPWTPSSYGERFRAGWVGDPVTAYVSRGLGVSGLPLRNVGAELAVFDLAPEAS